MVQSRNACAQPLYYYYTHNSAPPLTEEHASAPPLTEEHASALPLTDSAPPLIEGEQATALPVCVCYVYLIDFTTLCTELTVVCVCLLNNEQSDGASN